MLVHTRGRRSCALVAAIAGLAVASGLALAQPTSVLFNGSVSTSYTLGANWNGGVVPNNIGGIFYAPIIGTGLTCDLPGGASVQIDAAQLDANSRLRMTGGSTLRVRSVGSGVGAGTFSILGGAQLEMNQIGGNACDIILDGSGAVIFGSGVGSPGRVLMNSSANNRVFSGNGIASLQNDLTFEGGGSIGLSQTNIDNRGVFRALASSTLVIQPGGGGTQNRGTLEADAGTLILRNITNNVTVGPLTGTLRAVNGGIVQIEGTVNGGILQTVGPTSVIRSNGSGATLNSAVLNNAIVLVPNASALNVQGTLTGTAASEFRLESGANFADVILQGSNPVVFSGPSIILGSSSSNRVYSSNGIASLSLTGGSAVRGGGQVGLNQTPISIANLSTISADGATLRLEPGGSGLTNAGTVEARNGGTLILRNNSNNTGGSIIAQTGSVVDIDSGTHTGGTLRALGTGFLLVDGSAPTLQNFFLSEGELRIADSSALRFTGTNQINGIVTLNSGSGVTDAIIIGSGPITFTGTGQFRANASVNNRFYSDSGLGTLVLNIPFRGGGQLGIGQTTLTLNSLVDNDTPAVLVVSPAGAGATNNGTIRQSGTGLTQLRGRIFNESGRVEVTGAGNVDLDGCTISGGILADTGAGVFITDGPAPVIQSVTLESGELRISAGSQARFSGQHVINGVVTLNQIGTSSVSDLIIAGSASTTFGGTGEIRASASTSNRIYSDSGLGTLVLNLPLRGAGQVGLAQTTIVLNSIVDNDTGSTLAIQAGGNGTDNNGIIRQSGTGLVQLRNRVFNEQGRLEVTGSGNLDLDGCHLTGGVLADTGAGAFVIDSPQPLLVDVTLQTGQLNIAPGGAGRFGGTNTINGVLDVLGNATSDIIITGSGTTTFAGNGQIRLNSTNHRMYSDSGQGTLRIAPGLAVRGAGQIGVSQTPVENQGLILADLAGGIAFAVSGSGLTNQGEIRVTGAGTITMTGAVLTQAGGLIRVDAGRLFSRANGNVVQTGGTILADGVFEVVSNSYQLQGGTLTGDGLVDSNVTQNGGTIDPSRSLAIEGNLSQGVNSTFRVDIFGTAPGDFDTLSVTGTAALSGTLRVVANPSYLASPGDEFVVLTSTGARAGNFNTVEIAPAQLGIVPQVIYGPNSVTVRVVSCTQCGICNYDYNQDENVDLTDAQLMAAVAAGVIQRDPSWLDGDLNLDENSDLTDAQLLARSIVEGFCDI